jgi:hypothetical protein
MKFMEKHQATAKQTFGQLAVAVLTRLPAPGIRQPNNAHICLMNYSFNEELFF